MTTPTKPRFKIVEDDKFLQDYENFKQPFLDWAKSRLEYILSLDKIPDYLRDSDDPRLLKFWSQRFKTFIFVQDLDYEEPKPLQKKFKLRRKTADGRKISRREAEKILEGMILEKKSESLRPTKKDLKILQDPNLFQIITEQELPKNIFGERESLRAIFLSLCSCWVSNLDVPLNTLVSAQSSAGKSFLCREISKIFPKDLVVYRTKITPESFTYLKCDDEDWTWDGKIFFLEDISQQILDSPTFKVMCSEGSHATVVRKQQAIDLNVSGKPTLLITTARTNPNSEILNRFQIIPLDESPQQTRGIIFRLAEDRPQNYSPHIISAFSKLQRRKVLIPYSIKIANFLDRNFNFDSLRMRRDFSRLLGLIKSSAVLHQYQRQMCQKTGSIIAEPEDYNIARKIINFVQSQTFQGLTHRLKKTYNYCKTLNRFTRPEIHEKFPEISYRMWLYFLNQLCERKLLKTHLEFREGVRQQVLVYTTKNLSSFQLPEFDSLPTDKKSLKSITTVTTPSNVTTVTSLTTVTKDTILTEDTNNNSNNGNRSNDKPHIKTTKTPVKPSKPKISKKIKSLTIRPKDWHNF